MDLVIAVIRLHYRSVDVVYFCISFVYFIETTVNWNLFARVQNHQNSVVM